MMDDLPSSDTAVIGRVLTEVLRHQDWSRHRSLVFHDLDRMRRRLTALSAQFPPASLHALAIKANPIVEILRAAVAAGAGLEAASWEEVSLAIAAGCPAEKIVYDSPAKTVEDLRRALQVGVILNADNFDELERIKNIREAAPPGARIGIRINPNVGNGSIVTTSVAGPKARFGVPWDEAVQRLPGLLKQYPWLSGLHCHVGSQGCTLDQLSQGARRLVELRNLLHRELNRPQIEWLDIGGGLPATYLATLPAPSLEAYVSTLRDRVPELFRAGTRLITEFGRSVHAPCGWAISRVEYVKEVSGQQVVIGHLGADFMLRTAYQPELWPHRFEVLAADGTPKRGSLRSTSIGGPLCFSGDVLARDVNLPEIRAGDWILIRDVGAYTLALWSRHCSRAMPLVLGHDGGDPPQLHVLREAESNDDIVRFWSRGRSHPVRASSTTA